MKPSQNTTTQAWLPAEAQAFYSSKTFKEAPSQFSWIQSQHMKRVWQCFDRLPKNRRKEITKFIELLPIILKHSQERKAKKQINDWLGEITSAAAKIKRNMDLLQEFDGFSFELPSHEAVLEIEQATELRSRQLNDDLIDLYLGKEFARVGFFKKKTSKDAVEIYLIKTLIKLFKKYFNKPNYLLAGITALVLTNNNKYVDGAGNLEIDLIRDRATKLAKIGNIPL